jgi:hypothetical protein
MMSETTEPSLPEPIAPEKALVGVVAGAWLTPGRFAILMLGLIVAAFPDLVFGAKTFLFRDYSLFGYPLAHYHRECFWRGEIPLWNPLNNCGLPFMAQWNTMIFYPLSLVYLLLPMPWSLGWFCLLHLFLAGMGMYSLASYWTGNRFAGALAGIAFAFNGLTLGCMIWPNNIAALGLLPWVWLFVQRACNEGGQRVPQAILLAAVQMLSGAPEVILFTWVLVTGTFLCHLWAAPHPRRQLFFRFVSILILTACLAAVQLLPFLDLLRHSHRDAQVAGIGTASWSMPPWGWANFFVPLFRMTKTSMGVFLQPSQGWTSSYYLGIGVLALAGVAVWRVRRPTVAMLGLILAVSTILALGDAGHVYGWLRGLVPQLGFMRFPVKMVILAAAVTPLLAAVAIGKWDSSEIAQRRQFRSTALAITSAIIVILGTLVWFSWNFPGEDEQRGTTLLSGLTRGALLVLAITVLLVLNRVTSASRRHLLQGLFLAFVWLDLITHAPSQNPVVEARVYEIGLPPLAEMAPRPSFGQSRAALSWGSIEKFHTTIISNSFESVLGVRMGLYDNCNLLEGIPKLDGFYSLFIPEEQHIRFRLFPSTNTLRPALADFLGVSQISSEKFLEWKSRDTWMPMVTIGQTPEFADDTTSLELMQSARFDPRRVVFLPVEAKSRVSVTNQTAAKIVKQAFAPERITISVQARSSTMLVVAQTFYHCWKATIDGVPATLWRANHAFQALQVPAGPHRVELVYRDNAFRFGGIISSLTFLACVGWLLRRRAVAVTT